MSENNLNKKREPTIKEAVQKDIAELFFWSTVSIDPVPMPFTPTAPIVAKKSL